jgi:amino acid adenylation domain-containing protein
MIMTMDQVLAAFKEGKLTSEEVLQYAEKEKKLKSKYPLSEGQKGLWFLAKMAPSSNVYNVPMSFPLYENLERERFEKACRYLAKKHPILTIKMEEEIGVPYQKYQEPKCVKPSFEDVSLLSNDELQTLITERAKQPFNLLTGPLIRVSVFSKAPELNVILIVVHHIVFDAASMPILLDALFSAYGASLDEFSDMGQAGVLNYFNFVTWEKSYLDSQIGKKARNYWSDHLKGELPVIELPMEKKSTLETPVAGATYSTAISATESAEIFNLCSQYGVNLSVFFLCAYQILLTRYSGNPDVIVGMPAMGRTKSEFDLMIGYFVNMMPLRVSADNDKVLEKFLKEVQGTLAEGIDHSSYPFPKLVSELNVTRDSNTSPVFQVVFSYQARNLLQTDIQSNSESQTVIENINEIQQEGEFKLVLEVREQYDTFLLKFKYDTNILNLDGVKKISDHYTTLIRSFLSDTNQEIGSYNILSPSEQKCLLEEWTDTNRDLGPIDTLHGLFENQVKCAPNNIAVIEQNETLSYKKLNNQAGFIAKYLLDLGVQREELVGIIVEKGCHQVAAVMGVLMSGAACLPMDPYWPHNRQKEVVATANCKTILIAGKEVEAREWPEDVTVIDVNDIKVLDEENLQTLQLPKVKAEDLAYVIFTSGSTGKPKGVMIQHGSVVNTIKDINQRFGIDSRDSVLAISALSFDLSFYDIFGLLAAGGSVVFPSEEERIDPAAWLKLIKNNGVTVWNTVPSMLQMLVDHLELIDDLCLNIKLRSALLSGDWIPVNLPVKAKKMIPNLSIISLGGATEASIWSNYYPIDKVNINQRSIPYGKPLANQRFYILDDLLNLCPIGVIGNLYIAGKGLAKGYFGDKGLTESSFIIHNELKQRLYKTGDLGRWMTDGNMELLGRIDHQIKLRGFRIELGEIESKLLNHDHVHSCAVILSGKSADDRRLVAYLVTEVEPDKKNSALIDDVSEYLKAQLPDYMQPSAYMLLDKLPLTANGKIDRSALPEIKIENSLKVAYVSPQNDVEHLLVNLWSELLGIEPDKISSQANFFALGGHSLLAMRLISKLQEARYSTDLRTIFKSETLAALANTIDEIYEDEDFFEMDIEGIPIDCKKIEPYMLTLVPWIENDDIDAIIKQTPNGISNIQDIYPLAPRQEGILIHHLMAKDEDPYVLAALIEAKSEEILENYLSALQILVIRHDVLRTAVITKGLSAPVQVVHRSAKLNIQDLTHLVDTENETILDFMEQRLKQSRRIMDVSKPPLLRIELVRGGKSAASYLLLRWHHLIADHEGLEIIGAEVSAILNGQREMLPAAASNRYFIAHAIYQNEELDSEGYFTNLLGDITEPTYPFNLNDVRIESNQIAVIRNELSTGLSLKIRRVAQQFRTSPAILFHAAWALVVARCSGREDVVFGTVLSGRFQGIKKSESMLGMFINTLPLRISLAGKSVQELILDADRALIELMEYEQASLSMAQKCSGLEFGIPLFSALINYRHTFSAQSVQGKTQEDFGINVIGFQERTNYPFMIAIDDLGEDFSLELQIHQSISAERVIGYIEQAIAGITEALESNPNQMLSNLSILTESEKHTLLFDWNNTEANFSNDKGIHELFEEAAKKYPETKALVFKNNFLTYQELEHRSNQVANYLKARGVLPDTLIGLCVDRSLEMVIGMLGILKAGAAYVPLDPNYPQTRIEFVLEDSGIEVLLTQTDVLNRLPYLNNKIEHICLDAGCKVCSQSNLLFSQSEQLITETINKTHSKNLAYVIYTSGSTGMPKGVMVEHKAVANLLLSMTIVPGLQLDDILLAVTTYSFDISILEIFLPLITGARCHLCDSETAMDAKKLTSLIEESGATVMQATPTTWNMLFYSGWRNSKNIKILCGGEALLKPLKMDFIRTNSEAWNVYGPTETTIWSSIARIEATTPITIGTPIANTKMYVIDEKNKLVPIGVPGELCIAGDGLARGYLNRDDLTFEKFVESPFISGSLMYRTGDLVRRLENGHIEYLARIDSQVKIRGFRVELGEIESALQEHKSVQNCVVNDWKDAADEKSLIAYIVLKDDATSNEELDKEVNHRAILKEYLAGILPAHLIPSAFIFLESLPLTPNGKINRKALPAPSGNLADIHDFVAPRTALEESLAEIWAEVLSLEVEEISINSGFFDLGGHSVLSMFLVNLINKRLRADLDFRTMMDNPSIEKIAIIISNDDTETIKKPIPIVDEAEYVPLSFAQERLWFLSKLEGTSIHYNMPMALRFEGLTNKEALIRSLNLIISRHDVFRTRFIEAEDSVCQILDAKSHFKVVDLEVDDEQELENLFREEANLEFDFYNDHLIRAQLIKQSKNDYTLFITMHHIISDAMSIMVFYRELMYAFDAECNGQAILLKPVEVQYRDYASWQRKQLTEQVIEMQLDFWKESLKNLNTDLPIPTDRCRPAVKTYNGAKISFSYSAEQVAKLKRLSENQDSTLYMTLLAAFAILLNRQSHQSDLAIGSPIANRNRSELESVIGLFVNTLVMRLKVDKEASFVDVLAQVKTVAISAYDNQDIPFETLVDALNPDRNLSHSPLFQVVFNVTSEVNDLGNANTNNAGATKDTHDQKQLSVSIVNHDIQTVKFDLLFNIVDSSQGINAEVEYNTDLFDAETIERLVGQYTRLLDIVGRAPNSVIHGQDLMWAEEQEKVLVEWNNTEYTFTKNETLHGLFTQQVKKQPEKIAIKTNDGEISYQDLYTRAKRIASELLSNGISSNQLVGVVVEKGYQQVAAVMGVLFAGAAYLPVDTKWPSQRKEEVLRAGECHVVLSTSDLSSDKSWKADGLIVNIDQLTPLSTIKMNEIELPHVSATDLAYVIFTSGSTGKPKGVMIEHGAAANTILDINNKFEINSSDSVLALSLLSFDLSVFDIFGLLAAGGCIVFPEVGKNADPEAWLKTISSTGVTIWNSVPGMLQMLIDYIDPTEHKSALDKIKLRLALLSGDWIPVALPDAAVAKLPELSVVGLGGATEASIWSNYYPIKQSMLGYKSVPYGKPLANQRFYILDDELNVCPVGVRGNLFIAGVGLARGYWKDQNQTDKQFIDHPKLHQRLYKTGDLGRWLNDANIEFLGRNDEQVKVRGYRIELGEVEYQTLQHENVKANIVAVAKDKSGENCLVSYIVPVTPFNAANINSLRVNIQQHLSKSLPSYMVPDILMFLESLPLSENGKVDRKNLPSPEESELKLNQYVAPNTVVENLLARIWQEMLKVENVGIRDSFFELGGNSILTVRLAKRLRKELGYEISLRDIFRNPTIEMLSIIIENNDKENYSAANYSKEMINSINGDTVHTYEAINPKQLSKAVIWRDGDSTPIFIAHSVIAYSSGYSQLVSTLPEGIPVYGLQYSVDDFKHTNFVSMENLASLHIETIKSIQPEGPYRLLGHSSGGLLAYEIAYQLLGDDHKVEFLGMIDTHFVENSQIEEEILSLDKYDLVTQGISTLLQVANIETKINDEIWIECYKSLIENEFFEEGVSETFTNFSKAGSDPFFDASAIWIYEKLYRMLYTIIGLYTPPPLPIAVHLYQADKSLEEKPLLGWSKDFSESWIKTTLEAKHTDIIVEPSAQSIASNIIKALETGTASVKSGITLLQNIRSGNLKSNPIFCIPGAGGNVSQFIPFADIVSDNTPIYGIQHRGAAGDDGVPHSTLEAMAKAYTEEISIVAKKTPIQLVGHSLGAWIAFEIACRLETMGLKVAPLIVMDPDPFSQKENSISMRDNLDILNELLEIFRSSTEGKFSLSIQNFKDLNYNSQIDLLLQHLIKSGILPTDSETSSVENLWRIFASHSRIRYIPKIKFNNEVIIVMSRDTWCVNKNGIDMKVVLIDSWSKFAKSVRIVEVPGNHITMLNLSNIKTLEKYIDTAW